MSRSYESYAHQPGWKAVSNDWNFWQIFGKSLFRSRPQKGKSENCRIFIDDLMVGLGGLEPPTSPLSVLRSSVFYQVVAIFEEDVHRFFSLKRMAESERMIDIAILDSYHRKYES